MKYNIDGVVVVEGNNDVSYLSSFLNCLFFTTNGYDLNEKKLSFLEDVSKVNNLIIMTDPDKAGEVIRNKITKRINKGFVIEISGNSRKNYKKHGVAEADRNEIVNKLKPYITENEIQLNNYDLNTLTLSRAGGKCVKDILIEKYRLTATTIKSVEKQLNMLKITKEEITKYLEEQA